MNSCGAQYRKMDLQIHSPRDAGWKGSRPEDNLQKADGMEEIKKQRQTFCKSLIDKCIAKGINAIAITDHHEGVYAYEAIDALTSLREKSPELYLNFWLFPGMELTCRDSCQALIIFDADLPGVLFEKARSKLGLPADVRPLESRGIQVELLTYNIEELQDLLAEDSELIDRFIILPHVKPKGHKTVLRDGFHKRFKEMPYVGGYMDQTRPDDLDEVARKKLDGEIPAWASEKRGVISTSDARHADFRLIGEHATWIKIASPTAESLRQAMLAPDSRIRHSEPMLPEAVICEMSVAGSQYLADGVYRFNQQMNSIIGGRGAGKSTLLEYIRFALGCSAIDDDQKTKASSTSRLKELLEGTLDSTTGEISLKILLNGAPVTLTRSVITQDVIKVESDSDSYLSPSASIRELIPTQQFRQGELSDLAHTNAEDRLLELVTAPVSSKLNDNSTRLKKNAQSLSESLSKVIKFSSAQLTQANAQTQLALIKSQIENLEKQLSSDELESLDAVKDHDKYLQQGESLSTLKRTIQRNKEALDLALQTLVEDVSVVTHKQPQFNHVASLKMAFDSARTACDQNGLLVKIKEDLDLWFQASLANISTAEADWNAHVSAHQQEYDQQRLLLEGKQSILDSIERLRDQQKDINAQLEAASREVAEHRSADEDLELLRKERVKLESELTDIVRNQVMTIEHASSGLATGMLASHPSYLEIDDALQQALDLPRLRATRRENIISAIMEATDKSVKWSEIQNEALSLLKWKEGAPEEKGEVPSTPILQDALGQDFLDKLKDLISVERVSVLLKAILKPRVDIFHNREGAQIEFRKASQGEQAATLLNILMNQSHGPLIIDQPEEDLDNRIINEIIKTIRTAKDQRQLILATHNANIAVNGDSEHVIEMLLGRKNSSGAIDQEAVRNAITNTMEGGKEAFELRRKKYNF